MYFANAVWVHGHSKELQINFAFNSKVIFKALLKSSQGSLRGHGLRDGVGPAVHLPSLGHGGHHQEGGNLPDDAQRGLVHHREVQVQARRLHRFPRSEGRDF